MKPYLSLSYAALAALLSIGAQAQIPAVPPSALAVATCQAAPSGSAWGTQFLPCSPAVAYVVYTQLTQNSIVADQRCAAGVCQSSWLAASAVQPTDQVWTNTGNGGANWWLASGLGLPPSVTPPLSKGVANLTWLPAITFTDGSAIPAGDVQTFNVLRESVATPIPPVVPTPTQQINAAPLTAAAYVDAALTNGQSFCWAFVQTDKTQSVSSTPSSVVCGTVPAGLVPAPPSGGQVVITVQTAAAVKKSAAKKHAP